MIVTSMDCSSANLSGAASNNGKIFILPITQMCHWGPFQVNRKITMITDLAASINLCPYIATPSPPTMNLTSLKRTNSIRLLANAKNMRQVMLRGMQILGCIFRSPKAKL